MDRDTLLEHFQLGVREDSPFKGDLERLTVTERALYDDLRRNRLGDQIRLEQERIRYGWIERELREHYGGRGTVRP
jgi:hypothetical protein